MTAGPKMYQVYMFKDRGLTEDFVKRCKEQKFNALCLTVDTPIAGNRERDLVTGFGMPPSTSHPTRHSAVQPLSAVR